LSTVVELFADARARWAERPALRTRTATGWVTRTWADWFDTARAIALALTDLGVHRGGRVALLARPRREAAEFALAASLAGASLVTLPARASDDTVESLLRASGATVLVVDDPSGLARIFTPARPVRTLREGARALRRIVMFDARSPRDATRLEDVAPLAERSRVMKWPELAAAGRRLLDRAPDFDPASVCAPDDVAARVHTAGRSGAPRVVELTHGQLVASVDALTQRLALGPDDEQLAVISLSSVFGLSQLVTAVRCGLSTSFADPEAPPEAQIAEVNPTLLAAPPWFFDRLRDEALAHLQAEGRVRRALVDEALSVGQRVASKLRAGAEPGVLLKAEHAAAKAVALDALQSRLAGARMRFALSTGAPLSRAVAEWFEACGVRVYEGYGLAEAGGLTHVETPEARRAGTVGRALPGVETTLDGDEVVLRGPMIRGTLKTGDRGAIDGDGFLTLLGRVNAEKRATR
jgi:long-chain acyl-CoA synthetase